MKGIFKTGAVALAATALSFSLGGGMANAQEVDTDVSLPDVTPVMNVLDTKVDTNSIKEAVSEIEKDMPVKPAVRLVTFMTF